jgi:1,4-alpha-glucan branching enzyme
MALTKKYLKTRPVCKVTFKIEPEKGKRYSSAALLGDFNNWDANATPMRKLKNGGFSVTVDLETNKEYKFRYLFDNVTWDNEPQADKSVPTPFGDSEDSVVVC